MSAATAGAEVHELRFPGQLPDNDMTVEPGGCDHGGRRCVNEAELEVYLPAIKATRRACRGHAGYFMLAAANDQVPTLVKVLRLSSVPDSSSGTGVSMKSA